MFFLQGRTFAPGIWLALAAMIVATAAAMYFTLGRLTGPAPEPAPMAAGPAAHPQAPQPPGSVEDMVERLAKRLEREPDNADGWKMLGRSYAALGRYLPAAEAYRRAVALSGDQPDLLADYADVLAMSQGGELSGEPEKLALRALQQAPEHPKALALVGTAEFRRGDYRAALRRWNKALAALPPDAEMRHSLERSIADARQRLGQAPGTP